MEGNGTSHNVNLQEAGPKRQAQEDEPPQAQPANSKGPTYRTSLSGLVGLLPWPCAAGAGASSKDSKASGDETPRPRDWNGRTSGLGVQNAAPTAATAVGATAAAAAAGALPVIAGSFSCRSDHLPPRPHSPRSPTCSSGSGNHQQQQHHQHYTHHGLGRLSNGGSGNNGDGGGGGRDGGAVGGGAAGDLDHRLATRGSQAPSPQHPNGGGGGAAAAFASVRRTVSGGPAPGPGSWAPSPDPTPTTAATATSAPLSLLGLGMQRATSLLLQPRSSSGAAALAPASSLTHRVRAASPKPRAGAPPPPHHPAAPSHNHHPSAAAALAPSNRPSPGTFIRYFLAPLVLLPVAWPWLLLRAAYIGLSIAGLLAGAAVDALGVLADLLRRNRGSAEMIGGWGMAWLAWMVAAYWAGLAQLQMAAEDALSAIASVAAPVASALLRRYPPAARLLGPALAAAATLQAAAFRGYCFVHDEIVPVALDLAERLPLVHGPLVRAVTG